MTTPDERLAKMEVKIEHLEKSLAKMDSTLETVEDIAKATKTQLLLGVGLIVTAINLIAKFL